MVKEAISLITNRPVFDLQSFLCCLYTMELTRDLKTDYLSEKRSDGIEFRNSRSLNKRWSEELRPWNTYSYLLCISWASSLSV